MVNVNEASIVKLKTHGSEFDILVDSDGAIANKEGKIKNVAEILAVPKIFSDARKGLEASSTQMQEIFGTKDPVEVAKIILQKGDIPLTKEYKDHLRELKKKQIISFIHRNAVDPKTHAPHPPQRIEAAMEEAKVHINEFDSVDHQVQEVLKKIRIILPIKFETKEISFRLSPKYAFKCFPVVKNMGKLLKEDWLQNGSLHIVVEIAGGLEEDLYSKIREICHGDFEAEVLTRKE